MGLVLDLCCYGPGSWSAEVSDLESCDLVASATGATLDEARDAVLAQLTPEQLADLADLATSMIADLAAVALGDGEAAGAGALVAALLISLACGAVWDGSR